MQHPELKEISLKNQRKKEEILRKKKEEILRKEERIANKAAKKGIKPEVTEEA